ncbi:MAG: (2Fe-2S) ferredoxin domain-containing protein [Cyanobacteria bacterium P01_C01_bin.72]
MTKASKIVTSFNFRGELDKIAYEKKKIKYIKLVTEQDAQWIKIPKKLRPKVANLSPGCRLEVEGSTKQNLKTGKVKHKAQMVVVLAQDSVATPEIRVKTASLLPIFNKKTKPKAKVLICQKSNCWKKGGKEVCSKIESILSDLGLSKEIPIKKTGCLKQCKKAPALVMLPDKARYNKVKPKQVEKMVAKHLIGNE